MNVALIILIVVLLIIILRVIYYAGYSAQLLMDLSKANASVAFADIKNPTSKSFTYSMWIYVNDWGSGDKYICEAKVAALSNFKLWFHRTQPKLSVSINTTDTSSAVKTIVITDNFPVQRWVYIVVSVESQIVDCYLDGKLVKSYQLGFIPSMDGNYSINYGTMNAYLTKFYRIPSPTDPQSVWNSYLAGNGFSNYGPSYGFSFALTKDQTPIAKYQYQ